jgi:hypothetical protein
VSRFTSYFVSRQSKKLRSFERKFLPDNVTDSSEDPKTKSVEFCEDVVERGEEVNNDPGPSTRAAKQKRKAPY